MRRFFGWLRRPGIVLSDNRGGPWGPGGGGGDDGGNDGGGGGPRNPWGPRRRKPEPRGGGNGGRGGGDVTSLDEFLRRSRARFGGGLPGGRPYVIYGIIIAVVLWLALTSIHRVGPNEKGVLHEHTMNHVVVYLNDQRKGKAGEFRLDPPETHTEENPLDHAVERISIELK